MRPEFGGVLECGASKYIRAHRPIMAGLALDGRSKACVGWFLSPIAREQENMLHVDEVMLNPLISLEIIVIANTQRRLTGCRPGLPNIN